MPPLEKNIQALVTWILGDNTQSNTLKGNYCGSAGDVTRVLTSQGEVKVDNRIGVEYFQ